MGLRNGPILAGMVAVLGVATAALALAPPNDAITADTTELSIGTEFTVDGEGFGEKKPKAWLLPQTNGAKGPKKIPLKVTEFSDTQLKLLYKKPADAGSYVLNIQPKKSDVLTDTLSVSIMNPMPMSLSTDIADPKQEVTITGDHFGTKKGKVYVGDANAKGSPGKTKVTNWTNTSITFQAPKKQPNGTYTVNVINKAGVGQMLDALTIQNSNVGVKPVSSKNKFTASVGRTKFSANVKPSIQASYVGPFLTLNGLYQKITIGKGTIRTFTIVLAAGDLDNATFPLQVQSSSASWSDNTFRGINPGDAKVWATDDGITATIVNYVNGRATVTFSGTVTPNSGGATGNLNITKGTWTGPVSR